MPSAKRIAFITAPDLSHYFVSDKNPRFPQDDQVAVDFLEERGFVVEPVIWGISADELRKKNFAQIIMRSPWDYSHSIENRRRFLNWLSELNQAPDLPLENKADLMLWNLDKHYLLDLEAKGVNIVPTQIVKGQEKTDLGKFYDQLGPIVLKPCVSAAARDTFKFDNRSAAADFDFEALSQGRDFMIQPYLPEITTNGEWSLVFIDGSYSHAVHKLPKHGGWFVQDELGGSVFSATPSENVLALAERAFASILQAPLYARVDIIETLNGCFVGELELVEPELFFLERHKSGNIANARALSLFQTGIEKRL